MAASAFPGGRESACTKKRTSPRACREARWSRSPRLPPPRTMTAPIASKAREVSGQSPPSATTISDCPGTRKWRNRSAAPGASFRTGIINEIKRVRMLASSSG